jgi:predicted trehalose synthase
MDNKVGDNFPASAEIAKMTKQLDELVGRLRKFCISLSEEERQTLTRGRRGAEEHLASMAEIAKKLGLSIPGGSPDGILNDLRTDRELAPLEQALEVALELVRDTRAQARSEAHEGGYLFYGVLQNIGDRIPEVKAQIKAFAEFLSQGRRRKGGGEPGSGGDK